MSLDISRIVKLLAMQFDFDENEGMEFINKHLTIDATPILPIKMSKSNKKPCVSKKVKNITDICENIELINVNFEKCVKGYHLINSSPINETIWEDINAIIFSSLGIDIYSKSDGSHSSGMDINCSLGRISNKSAKYSNNKKSIDISSYRLTTVCSEKNVECQ